MGADIENEINKIRWERWRAKQKAEREKTCFYCWDNWNQWNNWNNWNQWYNWNNWNNWQECPGSGDCHSVSGPYIDFFVKCFRTGQSNCYGGTGNWSVPEGPCHYNAIIRIARAGESSGFYDVLSKCYWKEHGGCSEHCYMEEYGWNKPIYFGSVTNNSRSFGHAICAEYLGGDKTDFNNWKFFQYDDLDIKPGDWQMPCGTDEEDTSVNLWKVTGFSSCGEYKGYREVCFKIDKNCNVRNVNCPK